MHAECTLLVLRNACFPMQINLEESIEYLARIKTEEGERRYG